MPSHDSRLVLKFIGISILIFLLVLTASHAESAKIHALKQKLDGTFCTSGDDGQSEYIAYVVKNFSVGDTESLLEIASDQENNITLRQNALATLGMLAVISEIKCDKRKLIELMDNSYRESDIVRQEGIVSVVGLILARAYRDDALPILQERASSKFWNANRLAPMKADEKSDEASQLLAGQALINIGRVGTQKAKTILQKMKLSADPQSKTCLMFYQEAINDANAEADLISKWKMQAKSTPSALK